MKKIVFKNGFTLLELLIVIAIVFILAAIATPSFRIFQKESGLDNSAQEIVNTLRFAQNKTLASEGASRYGVYFNVATQPNQYALFKGNNYATRDPSLDETHKLPGYIEIYNINLGGGYETVFNRINGTSSSFGNLSLRLIDDPSKTKTIYIASSGLVNLTNVSAPLGGRLVDSRHIHLNLGWSIQNATQLKFYFPEIPQTETVNMEDYFNIDKTAFEWNGTFNVSGADQTIRIHTHSLDVNNTILCIHRDRDNGKNDQELLIYVIDGGVNKDVVHYLSDASDTAEKGSYSSELQVQ